MARRLERLLELDSLIRCPQRCTAVSLAKKLERSERTIRDDLAFLRDGRCLLPRGLRPVEDHRFGAPLAYTPKQGWHYTDPDWRLPTIPLTQGELFALTLGARMLDAYAGSAYHEALEGAIAQLAKRLPEQHAVDLRQLAEQNVLFRAGAQLDLEPEIWHQLERACQQRQRVWMRYATPGKPVSEREFDPYVLHFSRNNPYVTGWCHRRNAVRWFRVDRIQALKLRAERFEVDPSFDREQHFAEAFQHEVGGPPQQMAIWFNTQTAPYIRERLWHSTQELEEQEDGSLILRFVARELAEVKRWVLFYGKGAIALEPPELVNMVREEVTTMNQQYGGANVNNSNTR